MLPGKHPILPILPRDQTFKKRAYPPGQTQSLPEKMFQAGLLRFHRTGKTQATQQHGTQPQLKSNDQIDGENTPMQPLI